jgi:clan AA aspartic protease (TIGR02281 family)
MKTIKYLSILLSISLGANMWFVWRWYQTEPSVERQEQTHRASNQKNSGGNNAHAWSQGGIGDSAGESDTKGVNDRIDIDNIDKSDQVSYKRFLKQLVEEQDFDTLEYEVGLYLRMYPQDIEAMLLEAKAYYHTKPLSIALVHYQELLSQPLNNAQRNEVEKIIAVNTTRVIQQFSGDGAWDLLAAFIEPLVQIDPLNRSYLMALARAYGMQRQFTLMEDTLANFVPTDARANRLRDTIMARLENGAPQEETLEDKVSAPDLIAQRRAADVLLQSSSRGHFIASVQIHNTAARMLVDTGATTTAISDVKFGDIPAEKAEFLGLFNVNTAGGTIQAPIYKVKEFSVGKQTLENISVLVLPSDNLSRFDGLLGMNVLNQFDMIFDATSRTMGLYKKQ